MMQSAAFAQWNANHFLFRSSGRFVDRLGHFACFTMAKACTALTVTDHYQSSKAKTLTTFNGFRNAVDMDQLFDQLIAFFRLRFVAIITTTATTTATAPITAPAPVTGTARARSRR